VHTSLPAPQQIPFAFAGRVSTEDQQDPESSFQWQIGRARALIEPHGGVIVAEYFDISHSRALPWHRRPQASQLLEALAGQTAASAQWSSGSPSGPSTTTSSP
jgi:site-specific DNA recombinase